VQGDAAARDGDPELLRAGHCVPSSTLHPPLFTMHTMHPTFHTLNPSARRILNQIESNSRRVTRPPVTEIRNYFYTLHSTTLNGVINSSSQSTAATEEWHYQKPTTTIRVTRPPVTEIRNYFGEDIAFHVAWTAHLFRTYTLHPSEFKNNYFAEMSRGSEEVSYLRLTDFCITQL